jgi:hypothetical protein
MTQAVIGTEPVAAAVAASEAGEPTMEELVALVGDPLPDVAAAEPVATTEPVKTDEQAAAAAKPEPEVDAALERAKAAAAKAREGSRRYAAQQEALREQAAQVQRAAREAEQLRQENAAARAREEGFKKDPYKALKDAGMTDRDLAERALRENTPEAEMARLREQVEASEAKRVALEARLEKQAAQAAAAAERAATQAEYIQVADNEATCPELSKLTSEAQLHWAVIALNRITANGHETKGLTPAQVADAAERVLAASRKPGKTAPAVAKPAPAVAKSSGQTLTNRQAQTRMVAPAEWDSLSDEQQIAHIAAALPDPT